MPRNCLPDSLRRFVRRLADLVSGHHREPVSLSVPPPPGTPSPGDPGPAPSSSSLAPPHSEGERIALRRRRSFGGPIVSADTGEEIQPVAYPAPVTLPPPPPYSDISLAEYLNLLAVDESTYTRPKPDKGKKRADRRSATLEERFRHLQGEGPRYQTRSRTRERPPSAGALPGSAAPA